MNNRELKEFKKLKKELEECRKLKEELEGLKKMKMERILEQWREWKEELLEELEKVKV